MSVIGVPIKVLHEAEGHIVTVETTTGEVRKLFNFQHLELVKQRCKYLQVYRGKLIEAEDNMNSQMASVTVTYRDGRVAQLEHIYIRGSKIRFLILPDMLKNAPMLKNMGGRGGGRGGSGATRGKSGILRAQAGAGGRGGRGSFGDRGRGRGDRGGFGDRGRGGFRGGRGRD